MAERRREYWAGLGAVAIAVAAVAAGMWPVPSEPHPDSIVHSLFQDPAIIGLLRLVVLVLALYAIASVPALIAGGRWVKAVGTSGVVADDAPTDFLAEAAARAASAEMLAAAVARERDELWDLIDAETSDD